MFIERSAENGGDIRYSNYEAMEADFSAHKLHPGDLKNAVGRELNRLLDSIRAEFATDEMQELIRNAYGAGAEKTKAKAAAGSLCTRSYFVICESI